MGLTGGLVDAGNLFDCLYGLATGRADDAILDRYSDVRIAAYKDVVDPVSSSNLRRLWDPRPEAIRDDPFFQAVARAATDEAFAEEMKKVKTPFPPSLPQKKKKRHSWSPPPPLSLPGWAMTVLRFFS